MVYTHGRLVAVARLGKGGFGLGRVGGGGTASMAASGAYEWVM